MTSEPILIISADSVAAALLGALIETFNYSVRFAITITEVDQALRHERPRLCVFDAARRELADDQLIGRTRMRGVGMLLFGTEPALHAARALIERHGLVTLRMPADGRMVENALRRALQVSND
jgi:DNA-binding NtrC family response regulator